MKRSTAFGLFVLISEVVNAEEINLFMKFSEILPSEKIIKHYVCILMISMVVKV